MAAVSEVPVRAVWWSITLWQKQMRLRRVRPAERRNPADQNAIISRTAPAAYKLRLEFIHQNPAIQHSGGSYEQLR